MAGYAIKMATTPEGKPVYLQNMSEYTTRGGDTNTYVFSTLSEAETYAQNYELKNVEVVPYRREADDNE